MRSADGSRLAARETSAEVMEFVERMGGYFESTGLTRLAGRMLGWLLVCDPPHQPSDELAVALHASSGGISTTARQLTQYGWAERFGVAGDRRTFYRLRPHAFDVALQQSQRSTTEMLRFAEDGLALLAEAPEERRARLLEMRDLYGFLDVEFPALVRRYHQATTAAKTAYDTKTRAQSASEITSKSKIDGHRSDDTHV